MPTLMEMVIETFQAIGRQEQNATLIDAVARRLREQGMAAERNFGVEYSKRGCPTDGRIDLAVVSKGETVAVEVDHSRPRRNSLAKQRASNTRKLGF